MKFRGQLGGVDCLLRLWVLETELSSSTMVESAFTLGVILLAMLGVFFFLYFLIFKTSVFRISCNTFWAHSPPFSIPPESTFPFLSTQCIASSFLFNPANVICAASIVGGVAFHCSVIDLPEATFLKKTDFLSLSSYQLPIDFHLEGESLCSSPLAKLRFCLAWVCAGFFFFLHIATLLCVFMRLAVCMLN